MICAGIAAFAVSSCASTKNSLGESNSKELKIVLEGNATTGYSWEYTLTNEEIVSVKEKTTYLGKDGITGAPSKFEYSVKALKDGTTDLTFVYKRPFEADEALDTIVYKIEVKYGKILAEQTEEDAADVETVAAKDKEIVYVRYTVRRVGKQDLNEKEKGFPLEEVLFEYSFDGENYRTAGSMHAVPGRWVGVKNGMFCIRKANGKGGYVLAKNVEYSIIK